MSANTSRRFYDPRLVSHTPESIVFGSRLHINKIPYYWCMCPGPCGQALLRTLKKTDTKDKDGNPIWPHKARNPCASCRMIGKKNRKAKYPEGFEKVVNGYLMVKTNGIFVHKARILMAQKLKRPLLTRDRVRFVDNNPMNLDLLNLYLEADAKSLESELKGETYKNNYRRTPDQVAQDAIDKLEADYDAV